MTGSTSSVPHRSRRTLLGAAVIVLLFERVIPFGQLVMYPFTLLATWAHEMGHGVGALFVGQRFDRLEIFADASGLAHVRSASGWPHAVLLATGLLAPPLAGFAMLTFGRGPRRARIALLALALALLASLALWVRSVAGWVAVPTVALLTAALGVWGSERERMGGVQFLGLLFGLDTLVRVDYLFSKTATAGGAELPSDVAAIATELGGVYWLWGLLIACVSFTLLALGLCIAWWERRAPPSPAA